MSTEIENWAKKYEDLTNGDDTIKAMAKYYTCLLYTSPSPRAS